MSSHVGSQSPRGSRRGSQSGSRPGSEAGGSPRRSPTTAKPNPFGASLGYDPARDPNKKEMTEAEIIGKRVDLPPDAYHTVSTPMNLLYRMSVVMFHSMLTINRARR